MATQAGIGVLIGLGIGSGITALLMQRIIRRQDNALQQSLSRLNRVQEDHAQDLNAALAKMETDYEQQLAAKIERYQDTHEERLQELRAEYETRIAALSAGDRAAGPGAADSPTAAKSSVSATPSPPSNTFTPIPDPWAEPGSESAAPEAVPEAPPAPAAPEPVERPRPKAADETELVQSAVALGKAAAVNRKDALRAIPQLGQLLKAQSADVRLAAVTALQESGSIKSIPFLRLALRDADGRVVAAASAALGRFKGAKKPASKTRKTKKKRRR